MDFNPSDKESMANLFSEWHIRTYKCHPIVLYMNLLYISDWNYFQLENESKLMKDVYYKDDYSLYFSTEEFLNAVGVVRKFITENVIQQNSDTS